MGKPPVTNALTIDFEDWYHGIEIPCSEWYGFEDRIGMASCLTFVSRPAATGNLRHHTSNAPRPFALNRRLHDSTRPSRMTTR